MLKRVFTLSALNQPTYYNLRWNALLAVTDWSDDQLDVIAELRCGEEYTTVDKYKVRRQDS